MLQLDSENADRNLTSLATVLTHTPDATNPRLCIAHVALGDGTKNLDGTGGDFELTILVGGQTVQPASQVVTFGTEARSAIFSAPFPVPANAEVLVKVLSPNAGDTDVDTTATLYDVMEVQTSGATAASTNPVPASLLDGGITAAKIQDGAFTAAKFAAGAFDAVWSVGTRVLTAATNITAPIATAVWAESERSLTTFGTLVAAVAAAVWASGGRTLTSFGTLTTDTATAVWDRLTSALTVVGSIGKLLVDRIDAAISSRLASASYTAPDNAGITAAAAAATAAETAATAAQTAAEALPTAAEINAALTTAHGTGSWQTGAGGGGETVVIQLIPNAIGTGEVDGGPVTVYFKAPFAFEFTPYVDALGGPIDMSSLTLTFVAETKKGKADIFTRTSGDGVTVGGADLNEVAITGTVADTTYNPGEYLYALRDSTGKVWAEGVLTIKYAATVDE